MTKYELMVIAAAAAAFVLINIIMWSIIIIRENKAREKNTQPQPLSAVPPQNAVPAAAQAFTSTVPVTSPAPVPVSAPAPTPTPQKPRVKHNGLVLLDDIVITHTDDRID